MKKLFIAMKLIWMFSFLNVNAQNLIKVNDLTFGGQNNDESIFTFRDVNANIYTFGTISQSSVPKDLSVQYGGEDYSVVKYDQYGNKVWGNAYGGSGNDHLYKVLTTASGFMLVGISFSSSSGNKGSSITCSNPFPGALSSYVRVVWIVEIDYDGNIINETQFCTNWTFSGGGTYANPFIDAITDFIKLSNGQYILCGNFISYQNPVGVDYAIGNIAGFVRLDASFNLVNTRIFAGNTIIRSAGQNILYHSYLSATSGQAVELPNGDLMFGWTLRSTFYEIQCGDNSNTQLSYSCVSLYSQFDSFLGAKYFGSHFGKTIARKLIYYNNNVYFFNENVPTSSNTVDLNSCTGTGFYFRTIAAKTNINKKDCWVIKLSTSNVLQAEYAFGANDDVDVGDIILDNNNNFVLGMSVNSGIGFDKAVAGKGGKDYWILRLNSFSMVKTQEYCFGGSSDDLLKGVSLYNDLFFLSGRSYSDVGLDKSGVNRSGSTSTTDQWTVVMCQVPSPPSIINAGGYNFLFTCKNQVATMDIQNPLPGYTYNWYLSSTGASIYSGTSYTTPSNVTASTAYYVDANNGYCSSPKYALQLMVMPTPNPPSVLTNPVICKGDTLVLIAKTDTSGMGSFNGYTKWFDSDGITLLKRGDTFKIPNFKIPKTYYVSTYDSLYSSFYNWGPITCESQRIPKTFAVDSAQLPTMNLSSYYCYGTSVSLNLSNYLLGNTVKWSDQQENILSSTPSLLLNIVNENDTITVKQTTALGCESLPETFIIPVKKDSARMPQVSLNPSYCKGSTILLQSAFPLSASFNWYNGDIFSFSGNPFQINDLQVNDTVFVESIGSNGCVSPKQKLVIIASAPKAQFNATSTDLDPGDASHFVNSSIGGVSYYWDFGDDTYSTSNSPWHYFNSPGQYSIQLIVTDNNGCTDTLLKSTYINVGDFVGFAELVNNLGVSIYPNPFSEYLNIESINSDVEYEVSIFNLYGQRVHSEKLFSLLMVDTSHLGSGTYFLELKSDEIIKRIKVIKTK